MVEIAKTVWPRSRLSRRLDEKLSLEIVVGRPRKPAQLKIIEGTRDRRPWELKAREPAPPGDLELPPGFLTKRQKAIWSLAIAHMPLGLLKEIDAGAFAAWVACYDRFQQANEALTHSPMVIRGFSNTPMQSPWARIVRQESLLLRTLGSELGFSPVSRTRIALQNPTEEDDIEVYFK